MSPSRSRSAAGSSWPRSPRWQTTRSSSRMAKTVLRPRVAPFSIDEPAILGFFLRKYHHTLLSSCFGNSGASPPVFLGGARRDFGDGFAEVDAAIIGNIQGPLITHDHHTVRVVTIEKHAVEVMSSAAAVIKNRLNVVVNLPPVLPVIKSAGADDRNRFALKRPVRDVDKVGAHLCHQPARIFTVHSPVNQAFILRVRHRPSPTAVGSDA